MDSTSRRAGSVGSHILSSPTGDPVNGLPRYRSLGVRAALLLVTLLGLAWPGWGNPDFYVLTFSFPPEGGVVVGGGRFAPGDLVQLVAFPKPGFEFLEWVEDGETIATSPVLEFEADRNRVLVARFVRVAPQPPPPTPGFALGSVDGQVTLSIELLPTAAIERMLLNLRATFGTGAGAWNVRAISIFSGTAWGTFQLQAGGALGDVRVAAGIAFDPSASAYTSAYLTALIRVTDVVIGLRASHAMRGGPPPEPYLLYTLTLVNQGLAIQARAEDKGTGITFRDLTVNLDRIELCCGIAASGTLSFTKEGFAYFEAALAGLPLGCCGLSLDVTARFTPDAKELTISPGWEMTINPCFTLYADVVWDPKGATWKGLEIYGYKIRCCLPTCCPSPSAPGAYLELVTAFAPGGEGVPGGFREEEFEYVKVGACGLACCGGGYTFDATIYFASTGLFGFSRLRINASLPVFPSFVLTTNLELDTTGVTSFTVGGLLRF